MTAVVLLMLIFDVCSLNIEIPLYSKIAMSSRWVLYSIIILLVLKQLRFNNSSIVENIVYGFIAVLNFGLLYTLIGMVEVGVLDLVHQTIVIGVCVLMILACVAAANYNANKLHRKSAFFMIFTYSLAFSDIMAFCGLYLEYPNLFYYERLPAISAGFCLVFYTIRDLETQKRRITS
jgi:hypothetical protein